MLLDCRLMNINEDSKTVFTKSFTKVLRTKNNIRQIRQNFQNFLKIWFLKVKKQTDQCIALTSKNIITKIHWILLVKLGKSEKVHFNLIVITLDNKNSPKRYFFYYKNSSFFFDHFKLSFILMLEPTVNRLFC